MIPLAIVAIRTDGPNPAADSLLEVACATVDPTDALATDVYSARVKGTRLGASQGDGVWLVDAMDRVRELTRGHVFSAWDASAVRTFLDASCHYWDLLPLEFESHAVDVRSLAWPLVMAGVAPSAELPHVAKALGITSPSPACALDEVRIVGEVYRSIVRKTYATAGGLQ